MSRPLALFEAYGIEIEYMIVDRADLSVRPLSDQLLLAAAGSYDDVERGPLAWSNELVLHVIELKTNGPRPRLDGLAADLQKDICAIDELLAPRGARLMPTAMHPTMDPTRETRLWPHAYSAVYETFDRMFGCSGHGWSNLQSVHINLPFASDEEFGRLHTAIRLVLPLLPALSASSPLVEGAPSGVLDTRMSFYRHNARAIPSVTGRVIPELVLDEAGYQRDILAPIARDVAPFDTASVLEPHWVNARGAIARFDRGSIEIRVIDTQECAPADVAVAALTIAAVRALVEERWLGYSEQQLPATEDLEALMIAAIGEGERAVVREARLLEAFGASGPMSAGALWARLGQELLGADSEHAAPLALIEREGPLGRRILADLARRGATCATPTPSSATAWRAGAASRSVDALSPGGQLRARRRRHSGALSRGLPRKGGAAREPPRPRPRRPLPRARPQLGARTELYACLESRLLVDANRHPGHPRLFSEVTRALSAAEARGHPPRPLPALSAGGRGGGRARSAARPGAAPVDPLLRPRARRQGAHRRSGPALRSGAAERAPALRPPGAPSRRHRPGALGAAQLPLPGRQRRLHHLPAPALRRRPLPRHRGGDEPAPRPPRGRLRPPLIAALGRELG